MSPPTGAVPKGYERSIRNNTSNVSQDGSRSSFVNNPGQNGDDVAEIGREMVLMQQRQQSRAPLQNGASSNWSNSSAASSSISMPNPGELASRLSFLEEKLKLLRALQADSLNEDFTRMETSENLLELMNQRVELMQQLRELELKQQLSIANESSESFDQNLLHNYDRGRAEDRNSGSDHVKNIRDLQRAMQQLVASGQSRQRVAQPATPDNEQSSQIPASALQSIKKDVIAKINSQQGQILQSPQEMMRQGILNWQSKQFEQRRQLGSGQDQTLQLQAKIDILAQGLASMRRDHQERQKEDKKQQAQQEHQINLLTVGLNQCLGAMHILQDDVTHLRQVVERLEHNNSQQQRSSNVTNRSTNTMQPFMTSNSSSNLASGQVSRDNHVARDNVFDWNLDNFQIDLTHGLGSADSFLSGVNRTSSDPWSSFLPARTTESVNLGSVNLSRNSLADTTGAAALNNQVLPGVRANNYWDNFRSFSHQNRLSSVAVTNPIIAQVPPRQLHRTGSSVSDTQSNSEPTSRRVYVEPYFANVNSPTPPRRKQKINREQNRNLNVGANNAATSTNNDHHQMMSNFTNFGGQFNRMDHHGTAARVFPMPQQEQHHDSLQQQQQEQQQQQQQRRSTGMEQNVNAIKQSIYDCVNELIAQHEEQPDHLANIFQNLQSLDKSRTSPRRRASPPRLSQPISQAMSPRLSLASNNLDDSQSSSNQQRQDQRALDESLSFLNSSQSSQSMMHAIRDAWMLPNDIDDNDDNEFDVDVDDEDDIQDGNRLFNSCKVTTNKKLEISTRPRNYEDRDSNSGSSPVRRLDGSRTSQLFPLFSNFGATNSTSKGNNVNNSNCSRAAGNSRQDQFATSSPSSSLSLTPGGRNALSPSGIQPPAASVSDSPRRFVSRLDRVSSSGIISTENEIRSKTSTNFNDICLAENDIWQCLNAETNMSVPKNLNSRKAFKDERSSASNFAVNLPERSDSSSGEGQFIKIEIQNRSSHNSSAFHSQEHLEAEAEEEDDPLVEMFPGSESDMAEADWNCRHPITNDAMSLDAILPNRNESAESAYLSTNAAIDVDEDLAQLRLREEEENIRGLVEEVIASPDSLTEDQEAMQPPASLTSLPKTSTSSTNSK